jgi:short-subunit dehydrogenase
MRCSINQLAKIERTENKMKKAIVIGAGSGIGKEISIILVNNGYRVGICGRRMHLLSELKSQNPDNYFIRQLDVTDVQNVASRLEELVHQLGGLDLLIICSGTGKINEALDFNIEKMTIDTNVVGFTAAADWTFNYFRRQRHGHLVAVSSIGGLRGSRSAPAYNATKAFQINYLEALRQKATGLKYPIFVTDIRAGFVNTAMAKGEGLFWVSPVSKAAAQIFRAINKRKKIAYVTKRWRLIAVVLKSLPPFIYDRM